MITTRFQCAMVVALSTALCTLPLRGDEILLGRIPLSGVVVRGVKDCQVQYTMAGRPTDRPIDRVILHLDAMPALEKAETAAAGQQLDEAMRLLDEAMKQAREPWQKTWVHYRRTRLLADAGRYTPACKAWATLLLTSVDSCWLDTMPTCKPDRPDEATKNAALEQLRKALDQAEPESVNHDMIDLAIRTISNLETSEAYQASEAPAPRDAPVEEPAERDVPVVSGPQPLAAHAEADAIDALLDAGRVRDARSQIERWVANTQQYPIDRLLYQYGRALSAGNEPRDAAVRFMQCAILFSESRYAAPSLFEAARLYAGPLGDVAVARRLLERARSTVDATDRAELVEKINAAIAELNARR